MPKTMKKPMDKIVILTDLGRLVAYRILTDPDGLESPRAEIIRCLECPDAYTKTSERVSDSAGRFRRAGKVANGTRAGYGEQHNMRTEKKRRLVRMAAEQIKMPMRMFGISHVIPWRRTISERQSCATRSPAWRRPSWFSGRTVWNWRSATTGRSCCSCGTETTSKNGPPRRSPDW